MRHKTTRLHLCRYPIFQHTEALPEYCAGKRVFWHRREISNQGFENIINNIKLGKHIKTEPMLIEQLVGIAIETISVQNLRQILSRYNIDSPELQKLQNDLQAITQDEGFKINFNAEKLCVYDEIQRCFTDDFFGSGHIYPSRFYDITRQPEEKGSLTKVLIVTLKAIYSHSSRNETLEKTDQFYNYYDKIAGVSPAQQRQQNMNIDEKLKEITGNNLFMKVLTPALGKVIALSYRNKADVQATLVIIAIIRYKQDTGDLSR